MAIANLREYSTEQLKQMNREIVSEINRRLRKEDARAALEFEEGDRVWWNHRGTGRKIEGKVIKTNRRTVKVRDDFGTLWRVSGSLLTRET